MRIILDSYTFLLKGLLSFRSLSTTERISYDSPGDQETQYSVRPQADSINVDCDNGTTAISKGGTCMEGNEPPGTLLPFNRQGQMYG